MITGKGCNGAFKLVALPAFWHSGQVIHHLFISLCMFGQVKTRFSNPLKVSDLNKGFYQIPISQSDRPITAFAPHAVSSNLIACQKCTYHLSKVHAWSVTRFRKLYIDDFIVFSRTWDEHLDHLRSVLIRLRQHGLTAKPSRCEFGVSRTRQSICSRS